MHAPEHVHQAQSHVAIDIDHCKQTAVSRAV
jgi:hypothetical protein